MNPKFQNKKPEFRASITPIQSKEHFWTLFDQMIRESEQNKSKNPRLIVSGNSREIKFTYIGKDEKEDKKDDSSMIHHSFAVFSVIVVSVLIIIMIYLFSLF